MDNKLKYLIFAWVAVIISGGLYYFQGYVLTRNQFFPFFGSYLALFALFYALWLNRQEFSFNRFLWISIGLRLVLILAIPVLSNDFYRFIWDGELITHGVNPYAHRPDDLISFGGFMDEAHMRKLYHGMGELSQQHYTCYPPLGQMFFVIAAAFTDSIPTQIIILKVIMVMADLGIILVGKKILERLGLSPQAIFLYALNPFIILEFSGNLHFEGIMLFFLLSAAYLLMKRQWIFAAVFMAMAIQVKLIPLILLPSLFRYLGFRQALAYCAVTGILVMLLGILFMNNQFLLNMLQSTSDYFVSFEFNASIFYLVRALGFAVQGYDIIHSAGPALGLISTGLILAVSFLGRQRSDTDLLKIWLFLFVIYYLFATTVHPWYISSVLLLSVFTGFRFGLVWSLLVMLSYHAYQYDVVEESHWILLFEYLTLFAVLFIELRQRKFRIFSSALDKKQETI